MDLKTQIITEYLTQGTGFRKLAAKYGISRTTICKWVAIPAIRMSVTTDINKSPSLTGILATNVIFSNKRKINSGTG